MSIAKSAMLARLSIAQLGLSYRDNNATLIANQALSTGDNNAGYFRKFRVQRSDIADITSAVSRARSTHRNYTIPFGDDNWRLLGSTLVMKYTQEMRECHQQFEAAVSEFESNWDQIIARNQAVLGSLFDEGDYPQRYELANHFAFKTEFRPVPQSEHLLLQIESETLDELRMDIDRQNREGDESVKRDLWRRLYEPVKKLADKLSDQDNHFHDSIIGNIKSIVDILPDLNIVRDPSLSIMAAEINDKLCGYTPGQLRTDKSARKETADEALGLISKMDAFMGMKQAA